MATELAKMKGVRRNRSACRRIGAVAKPDPREAHQLLRTNRQSRQGGGNLNVLDQKTIQQSQDQDREQAETELKQTQLQSEP